MAEVRVKHSVVGLKDLKDGMRILSFLDFTDEYKSLSNKLTKWLGHNFKGASATVMRRGDELELLVEELQPGDLLQKIFRFPPALTKLTTVSKPLVGELKKRGFTQFRVAEKIKTHAEYLEERNKSVDQVNKLVSQLQDSLEEFDATKDVIEGLLTEGKSSASPDDLGAYVDKIISHSSQEAMATMVSLKQSDQTYAHCVDVGVIFQIAYLDILKTTGWKSSFSSQKDIMLAAFLHDFGKSQIPKDILDSGVRFERDSWEMKLMQDHPAMGAKLLEDLGMPSVYVNMAHYHHVKLNPRMKSSYPLTTYDQVTLEARILSLVDVYQALVGKRSYKKSWTPPETINYLKVLSGVEYPEDLFGLFITVMGKYPKSSLVELSDGSVGFVVSVPKQDLERPKVVLVSNARKEHLTNNPVVDLALEKDLIIRDVHDSHAFFQGNALGIYKGIKAT